MSFASSSRVTVNMLSSGVSLSKAALVSTTRRSVRRSYSSRAVNVSLTWLHKTTRFTLAVPASLDSPSSSSSDASLPLVALEACPASNVASDHQSTSSGGLTSLLEQLWDGLLRAVPKSKVSHSRKAMRAANKGLKDRTDLVHCASCGRPKLAHHICATCYGEVSRLQKAAVKLQKKSVQQQQQPVEQEQWKQL